MHVITLKSRNETMTFIQLTFLIEKNLKILIEFRCEITCFSIFPENLK